MNSKKVRNKLVERIYLKPKTSTSKIYKVGLKLYRAENCSLVEYVIHNKIPYFYILLNVETGETKKCTITRLHTTYNLSKKMVCTEIREYLNRKLTELSELEADEYSKQFYGKKQTRKSDFNYRNRE